MHIFVNILYLGVPDGLESLVFGAIHHVGVQLTVAPQIEHSSEQLFTHEIIAQIMLLNLHLNRLESPLMPLLDCDLHTELSKSLQNFDKLPQSIVALGVKFAVLEELIHCLLFTSLKHLL